MRARLTALAPKARSAALTAAVDEGDDLVAGAVLRAPAGELEALRQKWQQKHRPVEAARLARPRAGLADVDRAGKALVGFFEGFFRAPAAQMAERQQQAAADALARVRAS